MFLRKDQKRRRTRAEATEIIEKSLTEDPIELEKGDLPAIILAAIIVFMPFILAFGGALLLLWWLIFYVVGG